MTNTNKFTGNVVFLGERLKFNPPPLHKPKLEEYKPYHVKTNMYSVPKAEYPYTSLRFHNHLSSLPVQPSGYVNPYTKHLDIEPVKFKHEIYSVPHLGLKPEMEKGSHPNEAKFQMGMTKKTTLKDFVSDNLEEEVGGEENTLTRHRDEAEYEDITALPFEEQYLRFLKKKEKVKEGNQTIEKDIQKHIKIRKIPPEDIDTDPAISTLKSKIRTKVPHRKKITVQPIAPTPTTTPTTPPPATKTKQSKKTLGEIITPKVAEIEKRIASTSTSPPRPPSSTQSPVLTDEDFLKELAQQQKTYKELIEKEAAEKKKETLTIEPTIFHSLSDSVRKTIHDMIPAELEGGHAIPNDVEELLSKYVKIPPKAKVYCARKFLSGKLKPKDS